MNSRERFVHQEISAMSSVLSIGGSLLPHSLSYGIDQVEPGGRIILMKDHYNTPERDRIVRINDGLAHTRSVHERSTG